jgi:hypothetical protein
MSVPPLYRQLQVQLSQWITPKDQRHLLVFSENIAAILQTQSACLSRWLPYLTHRDCTARSQMERLHDFIHNQRIDAETFYFPLLKQFLEGWEDTPVTLTLDTSMLWDQYCLIEVCLMMRISLSTRKPYLTGNQHRLPLMLLWRDRLLNGHRHIRNQIRRAKNFRHSNHLRNIALSINVKHLR